MRNKFYLFLIAGMLFCEILYAQGTNQWIDYSYGEHIYALTEDANYIWIGTTGGLVRMEKSSEKMEFFNRANSPLPSNAVHAVAVDATGRKWVGSEGEGVSTLGKNSTWHLLRSELTYGAEIPVNALAVESGGTAWVGYQEGGLSKYDGTNWTDYHSWDSPLPATQVYDIQIEGDGTKWIGSGGGLVKISGDTWTVYDPTNSQIQSYYIYAIASDQQDNLWLATPDKGVVVFNKGSNTWQNFTTVNSGLTTDKIYAVVIDQNNNKWFGTDKGVFVYDGQNWTHFSIENTPLPNNYVYTLLVASNNDIWVGSISGLVRFDGSAWHTYHTSNCPLENQQITSITVGTKLNLWIGTYGGGLYDFDTANWQSFTSNNSPLPRNVVTSVNMGNAHDILIGTLQSGIANFDEKNWAVYQNDFLTPYTVNCIAEDANNGLWVGLAEKGLVKFNGTNWDTLRAPNPLPDNNVLSLLVDSDNSLWIGTFKGLVHYDGNQNWTVYDPTNSNLPGYGILSLAKDNAGVLWAAIPSYWNNGKYDVGGLAKFVGGQWEAVSRDASGLTNRAIRCFHIDQLGNKWIGTNLGLVKFVAENNWKVFDVQNSSLPTNGIDAITTDSLGNVWLATSDQYNLQQNLCAFNENGVILGTSASREEIPVVSRFQLEQNYPNPFNPATEIVYEIPKSQMVELTVFNLLGQKVETLVNSKQTAGRHQAFFNGGNLPSGFYVYELKTQNFRGSKKMLLLR